MTFSSLHFTSLATYFWYHKVNNRNLHVDKVYATISFYLSGEVPNKKSDLAYLDIIFIDIKSQ